MIECDALSALTPGVPLWVLPPLEQSAWGPRIDWYLGFQIRRSLPRRRLEFAEAMKHLVAVFEKDVPAIATAQSSPLMIASSTLLPNHQTVFIPEANPAAWVASCHKIWIGLGRPAARFFLPKSLSKAAFEKAWPQVDANAGLQLVVAP